MVDAGCGTGRVTEELLARLPRGRVVALDASPSMLEQAQARLATAGDRVSFLQVDLSELSPSDLGGLCPVDAVLSTATFHWVTDHDRLFANLHGILRPGGQLVAQCGGAGNIASVIEAVRSLGVERAGTWLYASPRGDDRTPRAGRLQRHPHLVPPRTGDLSRATQASSSSWGRCVFASTWPRSRLLRDVPLPNMSPRRCRRPSSTTCASTSSLAPSVPYEPTQ